MDPQKNESSLYNPVLRQKCLEYIFSVKLSKEIATLDVELSVKTVTKCKGKIIKFATS